MLRILLRAVRTRLRHASPGAGPDAQIGAVSFLHRFGSSLNAHFHFHVVVLDGVFTETVDGEVRFDEATAFFAADATTLTPVLQRRILRLFQRRGLIEEHTVNDMLTWQGTGGFSLDASVRIHGSDRAGRERLLRYCARPPFALDRLRIERPSGGRADDDAGVRRVFYRPSRPTSDGRALLALSPLELTVGFTAFILLIPLALTFTAASIRRLGGKRWQQLHRLIYLSAVGGVLHYLWLVKKDTRPPLAFGAVLLSLFALRFVVSQGAADRSPRSRAGGGATVSAGRVSEG